MSISLEQTGLATEAAKEIIAKNFATDSWRSTSLLIQLLHKLESYTESLSESNPDTDFFTAQIAVQSALELISGTYKVPTNDDRFEDVKKMYDAIVNVFIRDISDDAMCDMVYLGALSNYVAGMRTWAWDAYINEVGPSEAAFNALKMAKRDEKAVEIAITAAAEAIFS